jgi:hypothetical protein
VKVHFKNGSIDDDDARDDEDVPVGEGAYAHTEEASILLDTTLDDVAELARRHDRAAINTLAQLLNCRDRQAMVAAVAAQALVKIGHPELTKEKIEALVESRLRELIAEAEQRKLAAVSPR